MAVYDDIELKVKATADVSGLKETNKELKELEQVSERVSKNEKEVASSSEATSRAISRQEAITKALSKSRTELLSGKLEGMGNKLAKLLSVSNADVGKVSSVMSSIQKTNSELTKSKLTDKNSEDAFGFAKATSKAQALTMELESAKRKLAELTATGGDQGKIGKTILQIQTLAEKISQLNTPKEVKGGLPAMTMTPEQATDLARQASTLDLLEKKAQLAAEAYSKLVNEGASPSKQASAFETLTKATQRYDNALKEAVKSQNEVLSGADVPTTNSRGSGRDEVADIFSRDKFSNLGVFKSAVTETFEAIETFGDTAINKASSAIGSLVKQMGASAVNKISNFGKSISSVIGAFKRIMFYRMVRTVIKEIGQAFGEGIKNLYQWSKLLNGQFAQSMDQIATAGLYMKNSLGAMVSPIINALAPAVDFLIDKFVALLNVINQVLAVLTGAGYWTKAIKYPKEYAAAVGGATDNTNKLGLATIDQLTILDKSRGSGGGGSGMDYSSMFETEKISSIFDKVKEAIEKGDWRGAGQLLAEELNKMIDQFDARAWGNKLGTAINNGIEFAYGFMSKLSFTRIGEKIAEFINGSIEPINWDTVGRLIVRGYTALVDTIIGFITTLDWKLVGSSINDLIIGGINEFSEWLDTVDFSNLGEEIPQKLTDFIEGLDLLEVGKAFWNVFWKFIGKSFEAQFGMFKSTWDLVGNYIVDSADDTGEKTVETVDKHWKDAEEDTKSTWDKIVDLIWDHGIDAEKHVDSNLSATEKRMILFGADAKQITQDDWDNIVDTVGTKTDDMKTTASTKFEDLSKNLGNTWDDIKRKADTKWSDIKSTIGGWVEKIKNLFNFNWSLPNIKLPHFRVEGSFGWSWNGGITIPRVYVDWYAKGGFPDAGDLFIANENGAEMVGSMNGRTAVANQQEITEGIREGVYDAMVSALGNGKLTANVYLDGKQISGTVVSNINSETRRTGNSPLLSY